MKVEQLQQSNKEMVLYSRTDKDRVPFVSNECEFQPCGWVKIKGEFFPLGYKVMTGDLKSLGLRNNPNIMTFPVGEWVILPDNEVVLGKGDWGGIWTALSKGSIKTLKYYMEVQYDVETRAFLTAMYRPVYANSYRIKSQGVCLLEEIL